MAWSSVWREGRHHAEANNDNIPPRINTGFPVKADEKNMSLDAIIISDYGQASLSSSSPLKLNIDGRSADIQVVQNYLANKGRVVPPIEGDGFMSWASAPRLNGIYLYSYLTKNNFKVEIVDNFAYERNHFIELLKDNPKAVIISTTFIMLKKDLYRLVEDIRSLAPDIYIIAGGQFVYVSHRVFKKSREPVYNADPLQDDYLFFSKKEPLVDQYIISLRGEQILKESLKRLEAGQSLEEVPNSAFYRKDSYHFTREIDDISNAPEFIIDWASLPDTIFKSGVVPMQASTGCPHKCAYCNFTKDHRLLSVKPVEQLIDEMKAVSSRGARYIWFVDDNFRLGKSDLNSVCRRFVKEGIDAQWMSFIRADTLAGVDFDLLRRSGCNELRMGLESADPKVLENMNKKVDPALSARMVKQLLAVGINCSVYFVIGFPGETNETVKQTLDFLQSIEHPELEGMLYWSIYPFMLAPLSPVFEQEQRNKYGLTGYMYDWEHETMNSQEARAHARNIFLAVKNSGPIYRGDNMNHLLALSSAKRKGFAAKRHELSKSALINQLKEDDVIRAFSKILSGTT
jgi:p-methyltransferase